MAQRLCAAAVGLFFLCFLLSGSGGGVQPKRREVPLIKRRLNSPAQEASAWHLFGTPQQPAEPEKTLSWDEARTWVRKGLEAIAAADSEKGWQAVPDPLAALRTENSSLESEPRLRRRRQLLDSSHRGPGVGVRRWWDSRRAARRRLLDGSSAAVGAQGIDPDSLDVPADDPVEEGDEDGGGDGQAPQRAPTALVVVPTANVWNRTLSMIRSLEMCRDRFELLVRAPDWTAAKRHEPTCQTPHCLRNGCMLCNVVDGAFGVGLWNV